jgi:hypothetical protein
MGGFPFAPHIWQAFKPITGVARVNGPGDNDLGTSSLMELRASVRFPVRMKVQIETAVGKEEAETINVSASGVLLAFSRALDAGSAIQVDMIMPSSRLGTPQDIRVHCQGRVIRSYIKSSTLVEIATVIDNYEMVS